MTVPVELDRLRSLFAEAGSVVDGYLDVHYHRFAATLAQCLESLGARRGRVLDIGAHWLHQSAMFRLAGFEVTALDLPAMLEREPVRRLAEKLGIELLPNADLSRVDALEGCADDRFDLVLMAEVLEHLAFNPVRLWQQVHRVLRPGGRIVLTTPNYYALRGPGWRLLRFLSGRGAGIAVDEIIGTPDLGHHWKEYSLAELRRYFRLLSPDFRVGRAVHLPDRSPAASLAGRAARALEAVIPPLRANLYLEIELPHKRHGVVAEPGW